MVATQQKLKQTMQDVRMAHRFLGEFYTSLLGILRVVEEEFGLRPYYWKPTHHHLYPTARRAQGGGWLPHRRWCWDALPLYNFSLFYVTTSGNYPAKGERMLEVRVELDTKFGSDSASVAGTQSGCPDPNRFDGVEGAASKLHLTAFQCDREGSKKPKWLTAWNRLHPDYEKQSEVQPLENEQIGRFAAVTFSKPIEELGTPKLVHELCHDAKALFDDQLKPRLTSKP